MIFADKVKRVNEKMNKGWFGLGIVIWLLTIINLGFEFVDLVGTIGWLLAGFLAIRISLGLNTENELKGE